MIIDSHCHLTYEPMSNSLTETINRANKDGVKFMLTISNHPYFSQHNPWFHFLCKVKINRYERTAR